MRKVSLSIAGYATSLQLSNPVSSLVAAVADALGVACKGIKELGRQAADLGAEEAKAEGGAEAEAETESEDEGERSSSTSSTGQGRDDAQGLTLHVPEPIRDLHDQAHTVGVSGTTLNSMEQRPKMRRWSTTTTLRHNRRTSPRRCNNDSTHRLIRFD